MLILGEGTFQSEETASTKVLWLELPEVFRSDPEGHCGWSMVKAAGKNSGDEGCESKCMWCRDMTR